MSWLGNIIRVSNENRFSHSVGVENASQLGYANRFSNLVRVRKCTGSADRFGLTNQVGSATRLGSAIQAGSDRQFMRLGRSIRISDSIRSAIQVGYSARFGLEMHLGSTAEFGSASQTGSTFRFWSAMHLARRSVI